MMVVFGVGTYHAVVTSYDSLMHFSTLSIWVFGIVGVGLIAMMYLSSKFISNLIIRPKYPDKFINKYNIKVIEKYQIDSIDGSE
jgi:hypothetical protein